MKNYLKPGSGMSMTRFAVMVGIMLASIMLMSMSTVMIIKAVKCEEIDWIGMAAFVAGVGGFLFPLIWGKAIEKKSYHKHNVTTNEDSK